MTTTTIAAIPGSDRTVIIRYGKPGEPLTLPCVSGSCTTPSGRPARTRHTLRAAQLND